jgi:anti-sigma regulatory factor (Ser/Thr protein kinase)/CheY-like chemotaxis protein
VVADGPEEARRALRGALEATDGFVVAGEAADGATAVELAAREQADAVVLSLGLRPLSGLDALALIRAARPETAVVVASDVAALAALWHSERQPRDLLGLFAPPDIGAPADLAVDLDASMRSVAHARTFVAEQCERAGCGELVPTATLLVSELVTNAVVHAASKSRCSVREAGDALRVEVVDWGPGVVKMREIAPMAVGGRGLHIVDRLASTWGTSAARGAKAVWFQLHRAHGAHRERVRRSER